MYIMLTNIIKNECLSNFLENDIIYRLGGDEG